ncbi:MAG: hypothetical protein ACK5H2_01545, partial [Beutenbergiaceae bacterium]
VASFDSDRSRGEVGRVEDGFADAGEGDLGEERLVAPPAAYVTIDSVVAISDEETLRRFVLRARRVQAHSLVQNWDELLFDEATFSD